MGTRAFFLEEARKRIGKSGDDLFSKYGVKTHWCMMQVYYLLHDKCGIAEIPKTYSCSGFTATSFAKKRLNHDYRTAEVADIVFFELNGNRADGADHVGVIIENTGHSIKILEGNTNGSSVAYYDTSTSNVFEYPYDAGCFECIIDMSEFFADDIETQHPPDEEDEENASIFTLELRTLRKGMKGNDVKALQRLLTADGYSVGAAGDDGDFGCNTERAVIEYQADHNLEADGIAGKLTLSELLKK